MRKPYPGPQVARQLELDRVGRPDSPVSRLTSFLENTHAVVLYGIAAVLLLIAAAADEFTGPTSRG